jgi:hypothetical protein
LLTPSPTPQDELSERNPFIVNCFSIFPYDVMPGFTAWTIWLFLGLTGTVDSEGFSLLLSSLSWVEIRASSLHDILLSTECLDFNAFLLV